MIEECRAAYAAYEFHKVYHTLNQFCAVDLSSLYVDITKDRMYCDAPDSPRRRATQTAMRQIFEALCRLLAPILVFTAEEAWGYLGDGGSVHLQFFPEPQATLRDSSVREDIEELLKLRGVIGQAVEKGAPGKTDRQRARSRGRSALRRALRDVNPARGARGVFHPERPEIGAGNRTERVDYQNA